MAMMVEICSTGLNENLDGKGECEVVEIKEEFGFRGAEAMLAKESSIAGQNCVEEDTENGS
jgi:hypothetical protein